MPKMRIFRQRIEKLKIAAVSVSVFVIVIVQC